MMAELRADAVGRAAELLDQPPSVERLLTVASWYQAYEAAMDAAAEDAWYLAQEMLQDERIAASGGERLV